jgi:hypothetical protein
MRALYPVVIVFVLLASVAPARSWTASTRIVMIDDAIKLMPPSLRKVLERRRSDVVRGMLEPLTQEDTLPHRPPWEHGTLEPTVDAAVRDLVSGVETRVSFHDVARRFGVLAHFVADAGFPPGAAGPPGASHYAHFAAFCEGRRARFPLVYYGSAQDAMSITDFQAFTLGILERARAEDSTLGRAYAQAGGAVDGPAFDDRSVPFAIASLSYSHSVTDIAQAWLAAWRECHGDFGGTPYQGAKR